MQAFSLRSAALNGFLAVLLGAFGAHALKNQFMVNETALSWWHTAESYQMTHALVLLFLSQHPRFRPWISYVFTLGIFLFSGSLYALTLTQIKILGAITPLGGLCFLIGWLGILFSSLKRDGSANK